jgi:hypothetical protein
VLRQHVVVGVVGGSGQDRSVSLGQFLLFRLIDEEMHIGLLADLSTLDIVWRLVICGLRSGLFQSPSKAIISAPRERSGGGSDMQSSARLLGRSLGAALAAVSLGLVPKTRRTSSSGWARACPRLDA